MVPAVTTERNFEKSNLVNLKSTDEQIQMLLEVQFKIQGSMKKYCKKVKKRNARRTNLEEKNLRPVCVDDFDAISNENVIICFCGDVKDYRCRRRRPVVYLSEPKG